MLRIHVMNLALIISSILTMISPAAQANIKEVVTLNGTWELEPSDIQPAVFNHTVLVPSLVDSAVPSIVNWQSYNYFWYKKAIALTPSQAHSRAFIKIDQSQYGTEVWLNGIYLGGYTGCYTSHKYDATDAINYNGANTLLVRVGAKNTLPPESAVGHDFEKISFIPGIWGDASLILTENPIIERAQLIPHIDTSVAEARITINNRENTTRNITVSNRIFDRSTGNPSSDEIITDHTILPLEEKTLTVNIPVSNMKLWSPESPFLYNLVSKITLDGAEIDTLTTAFGMREFKIVGSDFYLNGSRAFLRGGNIAFHRFLSDPDRKDLPWNRDWIKKILIDIPKANNFNFFRNHLGQMYGKWYDIADEYGIMLEDEWAFWVITGNEQTIRDEFTQWLYDNWNHPSIIIWDAMNEPHDDGSMSRDVLRDRIIPEMKTLDPSRPWECGLNTKVDFTSWMPNDFSEDHPYIYSVGPVLNGDTFGFSRSIEGMRNSAEPTELNEFIWFWLDKNGDPSRLMGSVLPRWLGKDSTGQQRLEYQAFLATELVELWRRLGIDIIAPFAYLSIEGQFTSNWLTGDLADPGVKPVMPALKNAYAPFGLSIELWDRHFLTNEPRNIDVYVFNDHPLTKTGTLRCRIVDQNDIEAANAGDYVVNVPASQTLIQPVSWTMPPAAGTYYLKAELTAQGEPAPCASSKKVAHVFDPVTAPSALSSARIMVYDPDNEILAYLTALGLNAAAYNSDALSQQNILILGEGALLDTDYNARIPEITDFVKSGHSLVVIEPSYGITNYTKTSYPLLSDLSLSMNRREDKESGGYDSYCFAEDPTIPVKGSAASSIEGSSPNFKVDNVIDSSLSTRWSSQFSDPQWISLDLEKAVEFDKVILRWENAFAKAYRIQVSSDNLAWTDVYSTMTSDGGVDEIAFNPVIARYVRMYGTQRAAQYGYSLYEFEVYSPFYPLWNNINKEHLKMFNGGFGGEMISQCDVEISTNKRLTKARSGLDLKYSDVIEAVWGKGVIVVSRIQVRGRLTEGSDPGAGLYSRRVDPVARQYLLNLLSAYLDTAGNWQRMDKIFTFLSVGGASSSSVEDNSPYFIADKAIDNDPSTRWSSQFSDPQWICLDLGTSVKFNRAILHWEAAYAKSYKIQVSNDNSNWTDVYYTTTGDGGVDEIKLTPVSARYVRMYGTERKLIDAGYSLYEFAVYSPISSGVTYLTPHHYDLNGIPVYYIGTTMNYELHISNLDNRDLTGLTIQAVQEYNQSGTGFNRGDTLPGASTQTWANQAILKGQEILLAGSYYIPYNINPSLNQTHLIISQGATELFNDSQLGVWCPPLPTAQISGKAAIQGRTNHAETINLELRAPGGLTALKTFQVTTTSDGSYTLTNIPEGTHDLTAKSANTLRAKQVNIPVVDGQITSGINFDLLGGDCDNNNVVSGVDLAILRAAYGAKTGDPKWDIRSDFNGNGQIDGVDLSILRSNYGKSGAQ